MVDDRPEEKEGVCTLSVGRSIGARMVAPYVDCTGG